MHTIEFFKAYWLDIVLWVLALAVLFVFWFRGNRGQILALAKQAVKIAEQELGSGTGPLKLSLAVTWVYERLPVTLKFFLTEDGLIRYIEKALEWLKNKIDEYGAVAEVMKKE